jgi:hypothetical protein
LRQWWESFKAWLGFSDPRGRRGQVEDFLESPVGRRLLGTIEERRDRRGGFVQRLRAFPVRPSDFDAVDAAQPDPLEGPLPTGVELEVNVFKAPLSIGHGWEIVFYVTEPDASRWRLRMHSHDGQMGWEPVVDFVVSP